MASIKELGNGRCKIQWYDGHGVRQRRVLPKKKAQELYDQVCANKIFEKSGLSPALGKNAKNLKGMTFRDVAIPYRDYLKGTRAKGNVCYIDRLIDKWGDWKISQLTVGQVRPWLYTFLNGPVKNDDMAVSTVKKIAVYFKRVFSYAIEELEVISQNPLVGLINKALRKEFKRINKRTRTVSVDEFWRLVKDFPTWLKRVIICAWCSGMREDEILNLKWGQVDLVERLMDLQASETKEADNKSPGIEQDLYDVLLEIQIERKTSNPDEYVFLSVNGKKIYADYLRHRFRQCADKAGFAGLRIHDLRHSYTVRKRREGHDRSVIKAQTGHHTESMFNWYDKVDVTEIQEMAGYSLVNSDEVRDDVDRLLKKAREKGVSLGAIQALIGRSWKKLV